MEFLKTALSLVGWAFLCLAILNIPAFHHIIFRFPMILIPGFLMANNITLLPDSVDLNVLVCCAISLVVILPLTFLPRVQFSGAFMCSFLPFYLIMKIIVTKIIPLVAKDFQPTVWTTVIVWSVSILGALIALVFEKDFMFPRELKRKWIIILDRGAAAFFVAATLLFPMLFFWDNYVRYLLFTIPLAVMQYVLDVLLYDWFLKFTFTPPLTQEEREAMARREARREKRRNSLPAKALRGAGRAGLGTLRLGFGVLTGVANLLGADIENPIPSPNSFTNPYEQMEKDYNERIRPQREREEYERIQKETDDAIKFYNENY